MIESQSGERSIGPDCLRPVDDLASGPDVGSSVAHVALKNGPLTSSDLLELSGRRLFSALRGEFRGKDVDHLRAQTVFQSIAEDVLVFGFPA